MEKCGFLLVATIMCGIMVSFLFVSLFLMFGLGLESDAVIQIAASMLQLWTLF